MKIAWTPKSMRAFKKMIRKNPQLRNLIETTLRQLVKDPFHPSLRTHKLQGDLSETWSCSINYSYRIIFEFIESDIEEEKVILLVNLGSHDEVY